MKKEAVDLKETGANRWESSERGKEKEKCCSCNLKNKKQKADRKKEGGLLKFKTIL